MGSNDLLLCVENMLKKTFLFFLVKTKPVCLTTKHALNFCVVNTWNCFIENQHPSFLKKNWVIQNVFLIQESVVAFAIRTLYKLHMCSSKPKSYPAKKQKINVENCIMASEATANLKSLYVLHFLKFLTHDNLNHPDVPSLSVFQLFGITYFIQFHLQ